MAPYATTPPARWLIAVAFLVLLAASPAMGWPQDGASGPPTVWQFLGIPQAVRKLRDGVTNRRGRHPEWERKPPLKPLAAPENLESDVPAIKTAAEIKQAEDLKQQKIKAIRYLAQVGCGCYPGVKEALLAALEDCTEAVRYEAAVAFCQAAGNPCRACNNSTCCDPQVQKKLREIATGMDERGCYREPSARVRSAALRALNACRLVSPPEVEKEIPEQGAPGVETAPEGLRGVEGPTPAAPPAGESGAGVGRSGRVSAREAGLAAKTEGTAVSLRISASADGSGYCVGPAGGPCEGRAGALEGAPPERPGLAPEGPELEQLGAAPPPTALAGAFGAAAGPPSAMPAMIGDFFGGATLEMPSVGYFGPVPIAAGDRRLKVIEQLSPYPVDRVFYNYHHFHNATVAGTRARLRDIDVDRHVFGVEKTFCNGLTSLELRAPFASGLDATQAAVADDVRMATEFGDLSLIAKGILLRRGACAWTGGFAAIFPTADDFVMEFNGEPFLVMRHEAVHFQPFVAWIWQPNDVLFAQAYTAIDLAANGNPIEVNIGRGALERKGVYTDQNWMSYDFKLGFWAYRSPSGLVRGVVPTLELHYTTTVQDVDVGAFGQSVGAVRSVYGARQDVLNLTAGLHVQLCRGAMLNVYGAAPLDRDHGESQLFQLAGGERLANSFDGEFGVQLTWYY